MTNDFFLKGKTAVISQNHSLVVLVVQTVAQYRYSILIAILVVLIPSFANQGLHAPIF
jgi:hypothetical protein